MKIQIAIIASIITSCSDGIKNNSSIDVNPDNDSCLVIDSDLFFFSGSTGDNRTVPNGIVYNPYGKTDHYLSYNQASNERYPTVEEYWLDNVISIDKKGAWIVETIDDKSPPSGYILKRRDVESNIVVEFETIPKNILPYDDSTVIGYDCAESIKDSCININIITRYYLSGLIDTIDFKKLDSTIEYLSVIKTDGSRLYALGRGKGKQFNSIWKYINNEIVEVCTNGSYGNREMFCNKIPYSLYDELESGYIILKHAYDPNILIDSSIEYLKNSISILSFVNKSGIEIKRLRIPSWGYGVSKLYKFPDRKGIYYIVYDGANHGYGLFSSKSALCSEASVNDGDNGIYNNVEISIYDERLEWIEDHRVLWDPISLKLF